MLIFSLAACGNNQQAQNTTEPTSSNSASEVSTEPETTETPAVESSGTEEETPESTGGKTLVVYYSASGNTKETANYIARATGVICLNWSQGKVTATPT